MNTQNKAKAVAVAASGVPAVMKEGELNKLISAVCEQARKGEGELHVAAYQALAYAHATNNTNMVTRLVNELPNSARADALMGWARAFAPVQFKQAKDKEGNKLFTDDQRVKVTTTLKAKRGEKDWKLAKAYAIPFFNFKKPAVENETQLDFGKAIASFIKRAEKKLASAKSEDAKATLERQLRLAHAAEKLVAVPSGSAVTAVATA